MEVPSTEMGKTRAGTGLGALLRPGKSRCPFSIQVEMLKVKVDISHFIFKATCGIDCVINEKTSISALKFYLKWHIFSVDTSCKWWSQDLNPTQMTPEPMLSLLCSAPGISVDKWKAHTLLDKPSEVWNVYAIQNCPMTSTENVSFNPHNSLQLPLLSSFYSCGNWGTKSLRVSKWWI